MRFQLSACVVAWCLAGTTLAQGKPDFTGRWVLVDSANASPEIARELDVRESFDAPVTSLTVVRRSASGVRADTYRIGLQGGTVGGVVGGEAGPRTLYSVGWTAETLVIETGSYWDSPRSTRFEEHDERWALDAQGRLVITTIDRATGADSRTAQLVYRRP